ncbi:MAG: SDR family NAD(P)-dependent oxidoreductase [Pseudomonadota bacterium]
MRVDLSNTKALVTGGSSGIGFEAAKGLLNLGANVTITGRDQAKLELARDFLIKDTGKHSVTIIQADFSLLSDVEKVAQDALGCSILINNAGLIDNERNTTADGFERQWQVNVLAPALLIARLHGAMPTDGRIVNVASGSHRRASLNLEDANFQERPYRGLAAYGQSKLALIMLTRMLSARFGDAGPLINAVHPGVVRTNFGRDAGWIGTAFTVFKPFYLSARRGAMTVLHCACSPFTAGVTGEYYERRAPRQPAPQALDSITGEALLALLGQQLKLPKDVWARP